MAEPVEAVEDRSTIHSGYETTNDSTEGSRRPSQSHHDNNDISPSTPPSPTTRPVNADSLDISEPFNNSSDSRDVTSQSSTNPLAISWNAPFHEDNGTPTHRNFDRRGTMANTDTGRPRFWKFHMRGYDDDDETDWWFASIAVPLLAATLAPLANVLSIAALVTYWRMDLRNPAAPDDPSKLLPDFNGILYRDPRWCYWLNVASLICGFVGNIFLLFNFTNRIRYIIALPVTIILWYMATAILIAIIVAMNKHVPPDRPWETYSQGFWYAVMASIFYFICTTLLLINMLGYFLGHYPQRFELNDHQRTLILQTMLFFIWMALGGLIFSKIESMGNNGNPNWLFVDGLYFCDVTILTVGFGDLVLHNDLGRGLVFPYTVIGIVMLGLVISSISKFAAEISETNVVQKHADKVRHRTLERTTTDPLEIERHEILRNFRVAHLPPISAPFNGHYLRGFVKGKPEEPAPSRQSVRSSQRRASVIPQINNRINVRETVARRHQKIRLLCDERDRFDEMRRIQKETASFKRWWALTLSVLAFAILWCLGALVFWQVEKDVQDMSYFQALYFCYVSLLTIGYGDFAPQSNAGRPFFVVWSLIAVPTMTLLINDMGSTVIESFKRTTFVFADFTVLLKKGVWKEFVDAHPRLKAWIQKRREARARRRRMKHGLEVGDADAGEANERTSEEQRRDDEQLEHYEREVENDEKKKPNEAKLARRLALAIRRVASDLTAEGDKQYSFEEWAQLTRLIRFTTESPDTALAEEEVNAINWDWLGDHSPLMANQTEPEFVLDRLCESLVRYMRKVEGQVVSARRESLMLRRESLTLKRNRDSVDGGEISPVKED